MSKIGDGVSSFKLPPVDVVLLPDGVYQVSIGPLVQFVTSSHLIDQHVNQLERIYREKFENEQQPYIE